MIRDGLERRQNKIRQRPIDQRGKLVEARPALGLCAEPKSICSIRRHAMIPSQSTSAK
jgi:hypothetical protein